jgi:hypothetical protein
VFLYLLTTEVGVLLFHTPFPLLQFTRFYRF